MNVQSAYSATGAAWQEGPGRIYDRLAEVLVGVAPRSVEGRLVADVGAGTGAASRAIARAGGRVVAIDLAPGMLAIDRLDRPPAAVADARRLPLGTASCDAVVAAFSYNHVPDPNTALREAGRVVSAGGFVLASAYAHDDDHPVKAAADQAATEAGWTPDPWVTHLRAASLPLLATVDGALAAAAHAGLAATAHEVEVPFPHLTPADLVAWRLGMAAVAPFLASLPEAGRRAVAARALELLGAPAPLVRRMIVLISHR